MASLQETHRSLEAQLYASENAVTVAQYEIADRDSREDLLKRRNLDLETSLKVFEDWELQRADETARNEAKVVNNMSKTIFADAARGEK